MIAPPDRFAESVAQMQDDPALQAQVRANGRSWVEEQYDWRRVYGACDDVYARLTEAVSP